MNILFYTNQYPDYLLGGIERITRRLSLSLKYRGYKVFNLYAIKYNGEIELNNDIFDGILYIPKNDIMSREEDICEYIIKNEIDVLVVQMITEDIELLSYIRNRCKCKIVYAYHLLPYIENTWVTYENSVYPLVRRTFTQSKSFKEFFYGIRDIKRKIVYKIHWKGIVDEWYLKEYEYSDKYVLLSKSFIDIVKRNIKVEDKLTAIPNMLSYDEFSTEEEIQKKEKVVLIVSRMYEVQKKISKALCFWKQIESDKRFVDWKLEIVGEGESLEQYKKYVTDNKLNRVTFFGKQEPKAYYKRASVFMMTSAYEGWGITLTEAQQLGCVPIVLNTFSAAKDIIEDKKNGCLVDTDREYLRKLKRLMSDDQWRKQLAQEAIVAAHRYGKDCVTQMWIDLFESL